jgi:hypothetical protein
VSVMFRVCFLSLSNSLSNQPCSWCCSVYIGLDGW